MKKIMLIGCLFGVTATNWALNPSEYYTGRDCTDRERYFAFDSSPDFYPCELLVMQRKDALKIPRGCVLEDVPNINMR